MVALRAEPGDDGIYLLCNRQDYPDFVPGVGPGWIPLA